MDMKIGSLVGSGATADVYEFADNKVIKLYHDSYSKSNAEWEFKKTKNAYDNSLPAPEVYDLVELNGRHGFIMERINGTSVFNNLFLKNIDKEKSKSAIYNSAFIDSIRKTAHLLFELHKVKVNLMDSAESTLKRGILNNTYLSESEKKVVLSIVDILPKGDSVCHGDPNPLNILDNNGTYILIDWVNCVTGSPLYDIAEYTLMYKYIGFYSKVHPEIVQYIEGFKELIITTFITEYKRISNVDLSSLDVWTIPMMAAKLNGSGDSEYKSLVLNEVRRLLRLA